MKSIAIIVILITSVTLRVFAQVNVKPDSAEIKNISISSYATISCIISRDGLTYDQYIGETRSYTSLADGWRTDTLNGGCDKEVYWNPYIRFGGVDRFWKQSEYADSIYAYYRFVKGKKYTGQIREMMVPPQTNDSMIFSVNCVDGMLQGIGTLTLVKSNTIVSQCNFENGEMVGECKSWDIETGEISTAIYTRGSERWVKYVVVDKNGKVIRSEER